MFSSVLQSVTDKNLTVDYMNAEWRVTSWKRRIDECASKSRRVVTGVVDFHGA